MHIPNIQDLLMAFVGAIAATLIATAAVGATYLTSDPGDPLQSRVTGEQWAQIDAGSLATMHRSQPQPDQVLGVSVDTADTSDTGDVAEYWLPPMPIDGTRGGPH